MATLSFPLGGIFYVLGFVGVNLFLWLDRDLESAVTQRLPLRRLSGDPRTQPGLRLVATRENPAVRPGAVRPAANPFID